MTKSRDIADSINRIDSSAADATAVTIDANENVGIGTTSPSAGRTLTINNTTAPTQSFEQNGTEKHWSGIAASADYGINGSASGDYFARTAGGKMLFSTDTGTTAHTVIDSSGNVGIGTSSPSYPLHVSGNGFGTIAKFSADDGANNPRLLIYGSSDGMHIQRTSGSGATNLMFEVGGAEGGGTEAMRILSSGGITFNGDTAAANALDDYEEGTFTVTLLTTGSPNPTYTITNNTGYYTKVGRLVTANFYSGGINMTNNGSGAARISGLPFNANTATYGQYSVVSFTHTTAFTSNVEGGITLGGSTQIAVYDEGSVSSIAFTTGNPLYLMFTVTYWTD